MEYVGAGRAALDAEQVGVAAGVAPPSPQPAATRAAIGVLLQDLERAVSSERVGNLRVLMPTMAGKDVTGWEAFFRPHTRLTAPYTIDRLGPPRPPASAPVPTPPTSQPPAPGPHRQTPY